MTRPTNDQPLRFVLELPSHAFSVSVARSLVRSLHWISGERVEHVEMIISELVTNAVRYGSPRAEDIVVVELTAAAESMSGCVSDRGSAFAAPAMPPQPDQVGGFGLHIVAQLATSWAIEHTAHGNRVHFTV